jgi:hypothetical protein
MTRKYLSLLTFLLGMVLNGCLAALPAVPTPTPAEATPTVPLRDWVTPTVQFDDFPNLSFVFPCASPDTKTVIQLLDGDTEVSVELVERWPTQPERQVAVLFDLYQNSQILIQPMGDTLEHFFTYYAASAWVAPANTFAAFRPAADPFAVSTIVTWTNQPAELINTVRMMPEQTFDELPTLTPLIYLVHALMDQFAEPSELDPTLVRTIVVFSDGVDRKSAQEAQVIEQLLDQLIQEANRADVAIYTFFVQTRYNDQRDELLKRMAEGTQGEHVVLPLDTKLDALVDKRNQSILNPIWSKLVEPAYQCKVTYRATSPRATEFVLTERSGANDLRTTTFNFPGVHLTVPQVQIQSPAPGTQLTLTNTQLLTISAAATFDNYLSRQISEATSIILGANPPITVSLALSAQDIVSTTIPLTRFVPGSYAVQVDVEDEFGFIGSASAPFGLLPTPTAIPTPTPPTPPTAMPAPPATPTPGWVERTLRNVEARFGYPYLLLSAAVLALLAIYAFYQGWKAPVVLPPSVQPPHPPLKAVLYRIDVTSQRANRYEEALALQQVVKLHKPLTLPDALFRGNGWMRASRSEKPHFFDFDDVIVEELPGGYQLRIEDGKALDSIQINQKKAEASQQLQDDDVIQFGEIRYRFIVLKPSSP